MQADDEVQKQVAEVAKALYERTDDLAVGLVCAITRRSWSSPLMFGCRRRGAASDRVHAEQRRRVFRVDGRMPAMTCAAARSRNARQDTRGAFNRPI
jgi:hypothetical protein